jgi:hypothetical protein
MIVLIIIYLVSVIGTYISIRRSHRPGGEFENINPTKMDVVCVLLPVVNTMVCLIGMIGYMIVTDSRSFFRLDN